MAESSVDRVRRILLSAGHPDTVRAFPEGTRSAADAARAVGCSVAQIVKSLIFRTGDRPVLVLASGVNRVDQNKVEALVEGRVRPADGRWVRATTGFAIGGVAPIGHKTDPLILIDADLMALSPVWAAAGSPMHVFSTEPAALQTMTAGTVADVRED